MSDDLLGRYELLELVAVMWNDDMAQRFPNMNHACCRQQFRLNVDGQWVPQNPVKCVGWHCNRCGRPTNYQGHNNCPDRPA